MSRWISPERGDSLRLEISRGGPIPTPAQARADLAAVTEDQVRAVLRRFSLSVSYLLTRKEGPYV